MIAPNSKRILLITNSFHPEINPRSFRSTELVLGFVKAGHHVSVLCPRKEKIEDFFSSPMMDWIEMEGLSWWSPKVGFKSNIFLRALTRALNLFFAYPEIQLTWSVFKALKKTQKNFDLVISIAKPYSIHWGLALFYSFNRKKKEKWVADCGDSFLVNQEDNFITPFYFEWVEKWMYRHIDILSLPNNNYRKGFLKDIQSRIKIIPQGIDFNNFLVKQRIKSGGKLKFAYAGNFIPFKRDPREFIEFIASKDIDFEFYIYSKSQFISSLIPVQDSRFILKEQVPRKEVIDFLSEMDFLVNFENSGSMASPSKLIDYTLTKRPILSVKYKFLDKEVVNQFFRGDFSSQLIVENPDRFKIENVVNQFISLV
jgi:hypothetical protein